MNNVNQTAKLICHAYLNLIPRESINDETILKIIDEKILSSPEFASVNKHDLFENLCADFSIGKGAITELYDENVTPWLNDERAKIKFELWNRYKLYMQENDSSFPINDLDDFTDKILDKCVNPNIPDYNNQSPYIQNCTNFITNSIGMKIDGSKSI
jgi:hypothetical protein